MFLVARSVPGMVRSEPAPPTCPLRPLRRMAEHLPQHPVVHAPEFPRGLDWINTGGRALRLADLRGKVVLLDFWTYG